MAAFVRRSSRSTNIWPGYVDALATLLMVIIFLLMVFVLAQFFLSEAISGRDQQLKTLHDQISELANLLDMERKDSAGLRRNVAQLSDELQASVIKRDELAATSQDFEKKAINAEREVERIKGELTAMLALKGEMEAKAVKEKELSESARAQVALLNKQIMALREQIAKVSEALGVAERKAKDQETQISSLGKRLNAALATKVLELSRYRSEFFGRLREVLEDQKDVSIVGDRFIFQSEVLFSSGSAVLDENGVAQIERLAKTLLELSAKIPGDIDWVLRIDGHTDNLPIKTLKFPSNWELSSARAISVVSALIGKGIPPNRLAAAGFGEFQPLDLRMDEIAMRRNRRIELKLTER